jgi:hypothetical protein
MAKSFDGRALFVPGFEGVGLEILSMRSPTPRLADRVYLIRYDCCGTEAEMKYDTLYWRVKEERKPGAIFRCKDCATRAFIDRGHNISHSGGALPAHLKYQHLRAPALKMAAKGTVATSEIDTWLEIPRGTTAKWLRESGKPQPPKTEIYRIQDPTLALALSGAWR